MNMAGKGSKRPKTEGEANSYILAHTHYLIPNNNPDIIHRHLNYSDYLFEEKQRKKNRQRMWTIHSVESPPPLQSMSRNGRSAAGREEKSTFKLTSDMVNNYSI